MSKSDIVNKRHLEKMEETKMKNSFAYPIFPIGYYGESSICKKCKNCKFFNRCKLDKKFACSNYKSWQDDN